MPSITLPIIALGAVWALLIVGTLLALRAGVRLVHASNGAPFARRASLLIQTTMALLSVSALAGTVLMLREDLVLPVLGMGVGVNVGILVWTIIRFGTREEILAEHRSFLERSMHAMPSEGASDLQKIVQTQTASLEEGIKDLERTKSALLNVMEDLSVEKTEATESESRMSAILNSIADGILAVDSVGSVLLANPLIEAWTGSAHQSLVGKHWREVLVLQQESGASANEEFAEVVRVGTDESDAHHDYLLKGPVRTVPVSVGVSPVEFSGRRVGSVVVFRDVTVEKRIDRAKSEFISVASHQLRTPLTSINWYVESVLSGDYGKITKRVREPLQTVHASGRRLASLINALLNVSRIEMGHLRITPKEVDLNEICDEVIQESTPLIVEKDLRVTMHRFDLPKIPLDLNLVKIVVQNLIANAVKYTPPKGSVAVAVGRDGGMTTLQVTDSGVGIPKAQHDSVFKKMFRADNAVKSVPDGTGLGLYISRSIVEQFGGSITFTSEEGRGTSFTVRLPVAGVTAREGRQTLLAEPVV
jgi:two-component system, OmpR family, phosphate regulon sensor histidine kinase PhoR